MGGVARNREREHQEEVMKDRQALVNGIKAGPQSLPQDHVTLPNTVTIVIEKYTSLVKTNGHKSFSRQRVVTAELFFLSLHVLPSFY